MMRVRDEVLKSDAGHPKAERLTLAELRNLAVQDRKLRQPGPPCRFSTVLECQNVTRTFCSKLKPGSYYGRKHREMAQCHLPFRFSAYFSEDYYGFPL